MFSTISIQRPGYHRSLKSRTTRLQFRQNTIPIQNSYVFTRPIVHLPSQAHGNGKFLQQDLDRQLNALLPVVLYTHGSLPNTPVNHDPNPALGYRGTFT
ncbi:hypothetical protein VTO58DRAFT_111662 [Aureobasidium pullulans]